MRVLRATEEDGFWFMTDKDEPKIEEVKIHGNIALTFQSHDRYLAVNGHAVTSQDKLKVT
jgi:general stress protein 26